jgi:hypothetical protein
MNSTTTTTLPETTSACPPMARVRRRRWLTVLGAMSAANAAWAIAVQAGVDLAVERGSGTADVGPLAVTLTSLGVGLAAWLLLELLERWTRRPRLIWRIVACPVFVLSLTGPLTATSDAGVAVLVGLHLMVGSILIIGLGGVRRR